MANILQKALNSKLGMKLQGKSVVDNAANPASAYSIAKRREAGASRGLSPQNQAMQKAIGNEFKGLNRVYGSPLK